MHAGFWFLICYLLKAFDNFKSKEIAESIYEGAVEHFDEKTTGADANRAGHSRQIRVESPSSKT